MPREAFERCRALPVGAVEVVIPRGVELTAKQRRALFRVVVNEALGSPALARRAAALFEEAVGVTEFDRHAVRGSLEVLEQRVAAARLSQSQARHSERRRAADLRPADNFGPSAHDLKKLKNAHAAMGEAQLLNASGKVEESYKAMEAAKRDALKAGTDLEERRRAAWFTRSMREAEELEALRGGRIVERVNRGAGAGEGRVHIKRERRDAFDSMWRSGALGHTGKTKNGRPVSDVLLSQRRHKAGLRYRDLVEAASGGLKSCMNIGAGGSGRAEIARAVLIVNEEIHTLDMLAFKVGSYPGLNLLQQVVGQGVPVSRLAGAGRNHQTATATLMAVLDAIAATSGGSARTAVQNFSEAVQAARPA